MNEWLTIMHHKFKKKKKTDFNEGHAMKAMKLGMSIRFQLS
ncbi:MAG TPA: hypothetical protein VLI68_03665 [Hanamia sp.]|nr:hypothetical protein [Hanamia sp.]